MQGSERNNPGHPPTTMNSNVLIHTGPKQPVVVQPQNSASLFTQAPRHSFGQLPSNVPITVPVSHHFPVSSIGTAPMDFGGPRMLHPGSSVGPGIPSLPTSLSVGMPPVAHSNALLQSMPNSAMQPISMVANEQVSLGTNSVTIAPPHVTGASTTATTAVFNPVSVSSIGSIAVSNQPSTPVPAIVTPAGFPGYPHPPQPLTQIPAYTANMSATPLAVGMPPSPLITSRPSQPIPTQVAAPPPQVAALGGQVVPTPPISNTGHQQAQQFQRLKVEDALSYLDQVKLQFGNNPKVYNDFLDIMKEFKSQSIDTPGVISRVSNLFKGHPELIVGFNTFLPPGYKIEVQANDTISVQQPGQPTISLSQLNGSREAQRPQPVNLSLPAAKPTEHRNNLDTVFAAATGATSAPGQPVEFTHAISYVNKIKNRFQGQPDIYKDFLEILHKYQQKEQKQIKDKDIPPNYKPLSEQEVYSQVAKLFQNQDDLLKEFWKFLPDASDSAGLFAKGGLFGESRDPPPKKPQLTTQKSRLLTSSIRKHSSSSAGLPPKKPKPSTFIGRDVSLAEAGKYGSLSEFNFFDKVRAALKNDDVYKNFLRCLKLFNEGILSRSELTQVIMPFLSKFPELMRRFKSIIGHDVPSTTSDPITSMGQPKTERERMSRDDLAMEIDYTSCKRYGHSYRGLPKSYHPPRCSGRNSICREVLNDQWVSLPSWSEESQFVTSRKTQYEENIYRCEDERFELDMVIEPNLATIKVLEAVHKKMSKLSPEDASKFKLENNIGGSSEVIHRKAIHRIYGDRSADIIEGIKKNPVAAVPLVLRRLKAKDEEWREAQKQFNKIWREQNEKYYLKSLDHQGINFKQNDIKNIRSKSLLNEVECRFDAHSQALKSSSKSTSITELAAPMSATSIESDTTPHLVLGYPDSDVLADAMTLIIHHARRQVSTPKEDKQAMKQVMKHYIQKLFHRDPLTLSDDEDDDDKSESGSNDSPKPKSRTSTVVKQKSEIDVTDEERLEKRDLPDDQSSDGYSLMFVNNNWYLFMRLHQILCKRLHKIKLQCQKIIEESERCIEEKKDSTAVALRLKTPIELEPSEYYNSFLDLIKSLLDGMIESTSFEDQLREMFGIHAYVAFTLDKVIQNIVKQLQHMVTDELCQDVTTLWLSEEVNNATGGALSNQNDRINEETSYQKKAESMLHDENCFRIMVTRDALTLNITLIENESDSRSSSALVAEVQKDEQWSTYVDKFVSSTEDPELTARVKDDMKQFPKFLIRNVKKDKSADISGRGQSSECKDENNENEEDNKTDEERAEDMETSAEDGEKSDFNPENFKVWYWKSSKRSIEKGKVRDKIRLYKFGSLTKAGKTHEAVTSKMYDRWDKFLNDWNDRNVKDDHIKSWMEGDNVETSRACQTVVKRDNDVNFAPYRPYSRYLVKYENVTVVSTAPDDGTLTALNTNDESMDLS